MNEPEEVTTSADVKIERIGRNGHLHRIIPIVDKSGTVIQRIVKPLMVEFRVRDAFQTAIGAAILAIPAAYTEEAWDLGQDLPLTNIAGMALVSITSVALFVYFNFYKSYFKEYWPQFLVRVIGTYAIALAVVALLLTLVDQCPWGVDNTLAIKRILVVALPASMSATVADSLK